MIRVDPSPVLFYFYFFYSIRIGASRSKLIRPGLVVRVDPVRLLYLPFYAFLPWKSLLLPQEQSDTV